MSTLPEAAAISLSRGDGARALSLSCVTNDDVEERSREESLRRAKADAPKPAEPCPASRRTSDPQEPFADFSSPEGT